MLTICMVIVANHPALPCSHSGERMKRESAELLAPPTRPLSVKFRSMMAYMAVHLMKLWGGRDIAECAAKMLKAATLISGGIEMG